MKNNIESSSFAIMERMDPELQWAYSISKSRSEIDRTVVDGIDPPRCWISDDGRTGTNPVVVDLLVCRGSTVVSRAILRMMMATDVKAYRTHFTPRGSPKWMCWRAQGHLEARVFSRFKKHTPPDR